MTIGVDSTGKPSSTTSVPTSSTKQNPSKLTLFNQILIDGHKSTDDGQTEIMKLLFCHQLT
ncbi:hypothetical protein DERF_014234 [Dermatophagoides farinae]|uniref:Uncharacterized protein n=1 Tax=Dermatophagoides farinae TaxID=6954 RepID=A0A922HMJ4_DERFA|nr:hypothetical protein DERF_014234 [Dermatophagoides farinae]